MVRASLRPSLLPSLLLLACAGPAVDRSEPADEVGSLIVGFLLLDGVYGSELVAPHDVFQHTVFHVQPGMQVLTIGRTRDPVRTFEGLVVVPDTDLDQAPPLDVLVVPSAEHNMDTDLEDRRLIDWVAARGADADYVLSVCDGAFLLAEAGLLDGRECTTFPGDLEAFRQRYPHLTVREDVSFVADGPAITGAGGARSYDPAMFLVEELYGGEVARGVGRGLLLDWDRDRVAHRATDSAAGDAADPTCYLPGQRVDGDVTVEDADGKAVRLGDLIRPGDRGLVLCLMAGAEAADEAQRGGFWCEDTFNDQPLWRHVMLDYEGQGIRFVAVACPPVYHGGFGLDREAFLQLPEEDERYQDNRRRFVEATRALLDRDGSPFQEVYFDPRFRLLSNPDRGEAAAATGPRPAWQGRFKWHQDSQTYGTPTTWVLTPDREVFGAPFFMNVYESPGRKLRYTAQDVRARLDRLLEQAR